MARMRFPAQVPVRGFFYIQQETRLRVDGESLGDCASKVLSHRKYKDLPRATLEECRLDVERQICARLGKRDCTTEGIADEWVPVEDVPLPKLSSVMSLSRAAFEWMSSGRELVSMEEMNRRADICKGCNLNAPLTGCKCSVFYQTISKVVPVERRDPGLGVCGICSCDLKTKVNLPENVIKESNRGRVLKYPPHCWQRELMG